MTFLQEYYFTLYDLKIYSLILHAFTNGSSSFTRVESYCPMRLFAHPTETYPIAKQKKTEQKIVQIWSPTILWENNFGKQAVTFPIMHCVFSSYQEIMPQKPALYTFNLLFRGERAQTYPRHSFAKSRAIKMESVQTIGSFYNVTNSTVSSAAGRSILFYTRTSWLFPFIFYRMHKY